MIGLSLGGHIRAGATSLIINRRQARVYDVGVANISDHLNRCAWAKTTRRIGVMFAYFNVPMLIHN